MTKLLFFGNLRELAGFSEKTIALPQDIIDEQSLIEWVAEDNTTLKAALEAPQVRLCIDQVVEPETFSLRDAKEIAFLPPFSGG